MPHTALEETKETGFVRAEYRVETWPCDGFQRDIGVHRAIVAAGRDRKRMTLT